VNELLERYVTDAIEYAKSEGTPEYVGANAAMDRVGAVYCELRRRGRDAQERVLDLLNHSDAIVSRCARGHAMDFVPERFIPDLEEEATEEGLNGFVARTTLKQVKEGTWKAFPDKRYRSKPTVAEADRWPPVPQEIVDILSIVHNRLDDDTPALAQAFRQV